MQQSEQDGINGHTDPALSELDLTMIKHVTPGGNWQDIPESVPSSRLAQIRKMSAERGIVRTTYYGRLRTDQPAYTIATYYDRPGNGTNIHPWEHRTISHREAARLQSFPDSFQFAGTHAAIKRQIGNAVPPLFAFALGRNIAGGTFVDLFAGAGGLSCGLQLAGMECVAAQELDAAAVATYRQNHPKVALIDGDITSEAVKAQLFDTVSGALGGRDLDLVAGGPPCQGFSTAGWRLHSDHRNVLIYEFLDIIKALRPRLFLFENVEGILSMNGGRVVHELLQAFRGLGYRYVAEPWLAYCEQYGVPQMRRRVIILGSRDATDAITPPPTYFDRCFGRREQDQHRASNRYPVTVAEALTGLPSLRSRIDEYLPQFGVDPTFGSWAQGKMTAAQFLATRGSLRAAGSITQHLPLSG